MERSVLVGLAVFRWAAWSLMAGVLLLARQQLARPAPALALVGLALAVTVATTLLLGRDPARLTSPGPVTAELLVGASLLLADGFVYAAPHVFTPEASLGVAWPIAGVLAAGVAFGARGGTLAGLLMGAARVASSAANAPRGPLGAGDTLLLDLLLPEQLLSLVTSAVMYALAGGIAGYLVGLLRRAEREISLARAREEVARTLHDGVLQTLALVERRADDAALARLARDQERDLRSFLFGTAAPGLVGAGSLGDALRRAAARFEASFDGRVDVLVPDDLPPLPPGHQAALAAAASEALVNAGKHGGAGRVTVFVEPHGEGVFVSVRDDGAGFDPARTPEGVGLARSIRGRIAELGGHVEVDAAPGRGAEIRLHLPAPGRDARR